MRSTPCRSSRPAIAPALRIGDLDQFANAAFRKRVSGVLIDWGWRVAQEWFAARLGVAASTPD
jgi:hypothetical protein